MLDSSFEVAELAKTVSGITAGDLPSKVATVLPADSSKLLNNATLQSATASAADISRVNQVVRAESGSNVVDPDTTNGGTSNSNTTSQTVQAAPPGSLTLNWSAPTTRADGSPLSLADIDGYRIYLGNSPGKYSDVVNVADGTAQSANVTDLPAGTYYLVMTTYDNTGLESKHSAEASKMVR